MQRRLAQEADAKHLAEFKANSDLAVNEVDRAAFQTATAPVAEKWSAEYGDFVTQLLSRGKDMSSPARTDEGDVLTSPRSAGGRAALAVADAVGSRRRADLPRRTARDRHRAAGRSCSANVVARYALHSGGFSFAQELPERLFPWFIAAGVALAAQHGGHMSVEWLLERSGHHAQRLLIVGGNLLVIVSYLVLCRQALFVADIAAAERSPVLGLPGSHGYWAIAAACILLVLATASITVRVCAARPGGAAQAQSRGDADMSVVLVIVFCILMVLVIPVGHALIIASGAALLWQGSLPLMIVAQQMFAQTQSFPMLALPFFMLAGSLMMGGKLGKELLAFATELMGRFRGGPVVHDRGGLGRVRRRLRQRRRQRQRARLDPDPVAAQAGLSGGALCGQQRDLRGDRHPDPAVDPDDPLRSGQRRQRRRPVHRGRAARASSWQQASSGSAGGSRVGGATSPRRRPWVAASWPRRPAQQPGPADAGPDPARPPLRLRDADRDRGADRDLLAGR